MKDTLRHLLVMYLGFWARLILAHRKPLIIGVTGSVGKTTTKEAIAALLMTPAAQSQLGPVGKSSGTLNTDVGLPLAVLDFQTAPDGFVMWLAVLVEIPVRAVRLLARPYPKILVLEYAADRPNDIRNLVRLAPPTIAVVTAAGPAHLEKFQTVAAVAHEKAELVRAVAPTGLVILAQDNELVRAMAIETTAEVRMVAGRGLPLSIGIARQIGKHFDLPLKLIDASLADFRSLEGRLDVKNLGSLTLIDDTYNANPLSMELALDTLREQGQTAKRRVAILGDMRELGELSQQYHEAIGRYARSSADVMIGVGRFAQFYQADHWFLTSAEAANFIPDLLKSDDMVLVKGSRGLHMELIVQAIEQKLKDTRANH